MPSDDINKDAYPEPPCKTPIINTQLAFPNPLDIIIGVFYYAVDLPVTKFREAIDSIRSKNKLVYYHQKFRRVPYLTECEEGDYPCYYEADMQWRRDFRVDREILKVMQERMGACQQIEGNSYLLNCAKEMQQFDQTARNFEQCYGDLGANASARKCLMKQKQRMMDARAQSA